MTVQEQCYIAGPMRDKPNFGFDTFDSMAAWLRRNRKWHVHNPAEHDREQWPDIETWDGFADGDTGRCPKFDLTIALAWDLARVAESQHFVLLPGWEQSSGARSERHVAELTGSTIWLARQLSPGSTFWGMTLDMSRGGETITYTPIEDVSTYQHPAGSQETAPSPTPMVPVKGPPYVGVDLAYHEMGKTERPDTLHHRKGIAEQVLDTMRSAGCIQKMDDPYTANRPLDFHRKGTDPDQDVWDLLDGKGDPLQEHRVTDPTTGGEKGSKIVRTDLIPVGPLTSLATLYGLGARKYAERNWEKGYAWSLSYGALLRHALAYWGGEDLDPELGINHMACVAFHAFAMIEFALTHPELDDRPGDLSVAS